MNEKWYKSVVALLGIIMLTIQAISIVNMAWINPGAFDEVQKIIKSCVAICVIGLVLIFMILALRKKKSGPIVGMVTGLAYTYSFTVLNLLIGVAFFAFCLGLLVELGKENEEDRNIEKKVDAKKEKVKKVEENA